MTGVRASLPDDDGMILVAVLWLLALLGGLTMAMSIFTTNALSAIDVYDDRPRAAAAIAAGLNQAVAHILVDEAGTGPGSQALTVGDARVRATWTGESARIDVNLASAELLAGLFTQLGASPDAAAGYAATLVALRGLPAQPSAAATGKPPGYDPQEETPAAIAAAARGGLPQPGTPDPHKPIIDVAQLGQIPGLPAALMARAAPFLTTYSGLAEIDPKLAAPDVVAALPGMTRERTRTVLDLRGRDADRVALADALGTAKSFTTDKPPTATRIRVGAVLPDGFTAASEVVIVHYHDDGRPYRVLSWDDEVGVRGKDITP